MEQQNPKWIKFNGDERNSLKKGEWYKVVYFNKFNGHFTLAVNGRNIECLNWEASECSYDEKRK